MSRGIFRVEHEKGNSFFIRPLLWWRERVGKRLFTDSTFDAFAKFASRLAAQLTIVDEFKRARCSRTPIHRQQTKKILCSSTLCSSFLSSHSQATHSFTFFGFSLLREKYYTNIFLFLPASNAIKTLAKHFSVEWNSKKFFISIFFFRFSQPRLFCLLFFLLSADNEARMLR